MTVLRPSRPPASCTTTRVLPETEAMLVCSEAAATGWAKTDGMAAPTEPMASFCCKKARRLNTASLLGEVELGRTEDEVGEAAQLLRRNGCVLAAGEVGHCRSGPGGDIAVEGQADVVVERLAHGAEGGRGC